MPIPTKHQFIKEAKEIYGLMEERRDYAAISNSVNIISLGLVALQSIKTPLLSDLLKKKDEELTDAVNQLLTQNEEVKSSTSLKNILRIIQLFINLSNDVPVSDVEYAFRIEEKEVNVSEKKQTLEDTFHIQFQRVPERFKLLHLFEQALKAKLLSEKEAELIRSNTLALQELEAIENRYQKKLEENTKDHLGEQQRLRDLYTESQATYDKLLTEQQKLQYHLDKTKELLDDEIISHAHTRSELEENKDKLNSAIQNLQSALKTYHKEIKSIEEYNEEQIKDYHQRFLNLSDQIDHQKESIGQLKRKLGFLNQRERELIEEKSSTLKALQTEKDEMTASLQLEINANKKLEQILLDQKKEMDQLLVAHEKLSHDHQQLERRGLLHQQIQAKHIEKQDSTIMTLKQADSKKELVELKKQLSTVEWRYLHLEKQHGSVLGTLRGEREVNAKLRKEFNKLKYAPQTNLFKPAEQQHTKQHVHKKKYNQARIQK